MKYVCGETLGDLEPVYDLFPSEFTLLIAVTQGMLFVFLLLCGTGRFPYGESPRTPPLEGTSLHR